MQDKYFAIFAAVACIDNVLEGSNFGNMPWRYMPYKKISHQYDNLYD